MTRISVVVRTRPTASFAQDAIKLHSDRKSVSIELPRATTDEYLNNQSSSHSWSFDHVLHNASQDDVYATAAAPIVSDVLRGINGTVLMYGQTGSGKTYTTVGDMANFKYRGIVPRVLNDLFSYVADHPENEVELAVSYLEIYNDQLSDLLGSLPGERPAHSADLQLCEDAKSAEISVKGQRVVRVATEEEALNLLFEGESNRAVAVHELNKHSTRGHAVFTVHAAVRSRVESHGRVLSAKLNLVDLAGSERLKKTNTAGERMAESMAINRSLSYLEQLVVALAQKGRAHLPYRQSKLTHLLKDAIGGNCKTTLVACVYAEGAHLEETVSTLAFAARAMRVHNAPLANETADPATLLRRYKAEVAQLKHELAMHDALASRSRVAYDAYTDAQKAELAQGLKRYLQGGPELEIESVRQMKELLVQMRHIYNGLQAEVKGAAAQADADVAAAASAAAAAAADSAAAAGAGADAAGAGAGDVGELDHARTAAMAIGRAPDGARPAGGLEAPARRAQPTSPAQLSPDARAAAAERAGGGADGGPDSMVPRAEAFGMFKVGKGKGTSAQLLEHKEAQRRLREQLKAHAAGVNALKARIDAETSALASKREERARIEARAAGGDAASPLGGSDDVIIDEEEYAHIKALKELKAAYRDEHDAYQSASQGLARETEAVDSLRTQLLKEFDEWYDGAPLDVFQPVKKGNAGADAMDNEEAFELMQQDRVRSAEPDSVAFFNANMSLKKRGKHVRPV